MENKALFGRLDESCQLILVYKWVDSVSKRLVSKEQHPAWLSKATLRGILSDLKVEITPEIESMEKIDLVDLLESHLMRLDRIEI